MIVDGEVDEAFVAAMECVARHESGRKHPISALARNVVDAVLREEEFPREESIPSRRPGHAGGDDRAVLVAVTGEEVGEELGGERVGHDERPRHRYACEA